MSKKSPPSKRIQNKKALWNYEIIEEYVAGMVLTGGEVKSLRAGRGSLQGSFVSLRSGEAWVRNFHIPPWEFAQHKDEPLRERKLLLKKRELRKLEKKLDEQGFTLVPLAVFFQKGFAKISIALARGKKKHDKRETLKKRSEERNIQQRMKKHLN